MCRLLGIVSNKQTKLLTMYDTLSVVLRKLCKDYGKCHRDGCGIAWFLNNSWHIKKFAEPLWESKNLRHVVDRVESKAIIVHARKATYPINSPMGLRIENSHPYIYEENGTQFVFAHNGHIIFDETHIKIDPRHRTLHIDDYTEPLTSYGTDSEIFLRLLVHKMNTYNADEPGQIVRVLKEILVDPLIKDFRAINFIMGTNKFIYALRYYNECYSDCEEKYTLYYLRKNHNGTYENENDIFISSEPLTGRKWISATKDIAHVLNSEKWIELKNRHLLYVPIGQPKKIKIAKLKI